MLCSLLELEPSRAGSGPGCSYSAQRMHLRLQQSMGAVPAGQAEVGQGWVPLAATQRSWWLDLVTCPCHLPFPAGKENLPCFALLKSNCGRCELIQLSGQVLSSCSPLLGSLNLRGIREKKLPTLC